LVPVAGSLSRRRGDGGRREVVLPGGSRFVLEAKSLVPNFSSHHGGGLQVWEPQMFLFRGSGCASSTMATSTELHRPHEMRSMGGLHRFPWVSSNRMAVLLFLQFRRQFLLPADGHGVVPCRRCLSKWLRPRRMQSSVREEEDLDLIAFSFTV